ncbi:uncharacterized protein Dwil_GK19420 [Drosophila willistoni]|uniref:Uncharacterized protein n=1 Tax=Drosophila willistoni TaxID=7260 RepID=B4MYA8_DROWI|nr:uncharacterized protein Dwil_GK19420 [Drosophila willistoni]
MCCSGEKFNPFYVGPYPECACGVCPYGCYSGFTRCGWDGGNGPFGNWLRTFQITVLKIDMNDELIGTKLKQEMAKRGKVEKLLVYK